MAGKGQCYSPVTPADALAGPGPQFFSASRLDSPESSCSWARTYAWTQAGWCHARSRKAQPMALRRKNSLLARLGSMHGSEQVGVRGLPRADLVDDRGPAPPHVVVARPFAHDRDELDRAGTDQRANGPCGQGVDVVPPGAGHDEMVDERQCPGISVRGVGTMAEDGDGGVPLLAVGRAVPELEDRVHPDLAIGDLMACQRLAEDRLLPRAGHAAIGQVGLHVRLHAGSLQRVGLLRQRAPKGSDERTVRAHALRSRA